MDRKSQMQGLMNAFIQIKSLLMANFSRITVSLAGSVAKGTFLSGHRELDVFVTLRNKQDYGAFWLKLAQLFPNGQFHKTSIPYVTIKRGEYSADIVPILGHGHSYLDAKTGKPKNIETLLHVDYIRGRLTDTALTRILRVKETFTSMGIYGADSKIGGFSGYFCELLGLMPLEKRLCVLKNLSLGRPFTDPVNPRRNMGAAVLPEVAASAYRASLSVELSVDVDSHWYRGVVDNWTKLGHYRRAAKAAKKLFSILYYTNGKGVIWACMASERPLCRFIRGPSIVSGSTSEYHKKYKSFAYGGHYWHKQTLQFSHYSKVRFGVQFKRTIAPANVSELREFAV